jgi:hypothetical protein
VHWSPSGSPQDKNPIVADVNKLLREIPDNFCAC